MTENQSQIDQLLYKMEMLLIRQEVFAKEIDELRKEINRLRTSETTTPPPPKEVVKPIIPEPEIKPAPEKEKGHPATGYATGVYTANQTAGKANNTKGSKSNLNIEKFIGENLINKIGIIIIVIGVAIGAKYAIEHQLISPLTRIILGYLAGAGLLGFAIKLKKDYTNFSAVLLSGSMAIFYFITYLAYSLYGLLPQFFAFGLMVVFTVFTVVAAIHYNRQVIAHIGLVGAYAVPFLLSEGSGKVAVLFSYMAIINAGILIIAFKKYWKPLYYAAFILTWAIFLAWYTNSYKADDHFALAWVFLSLFFATFYLMFLSYKLIQKEKFDITDIVLLLLNSFVFYGIGYALLNNHETGQHLLGIFTVGNALVHFVVATIIHRQKLADRNLFFLVSGLVLVFITIAIPVQLNGNWVTLLWAGEAALLFWLGRTKVFAIYEKLSYILMGIAFVSLIQDWSLTYNQYQREVADTFIQPVFNIHFLTSLLFVAAFGFINWLNNQSQYKSPRLFGDEFAKVIGFSIPAVLLIALYFSFRLEIENYYHQLFVNSAIDITIEENEYSQTTFNNDLIGFKSIWLINYSLLFFTLLSVVNIKKIKNQQLGFINLALNSFAILTFLFQALYLFSDLRDSYTTQTLSEYYRIGWMHIGIRYVSFVFVALILFSTYQYIKQSFMKVNYKMAFDILLHVTLLWAISSELISWIDLIGSVPSYKLVLSILWGFYSLLLIGWGIRKNIKYLRIGGIGLFGITLLKLFFYDISHLSTGLKTIVFVSLGVLLLITSFLYNKYRHRIEDEEKVMQKTEDETI